MTSRKTVASNWAEDVHKQPVMTLFIIPENKETVNEQHLSQEFKIIDHWEGGWQTVSKTEIRTKSWNEQNTECWLLIREEALAVLHLRATIIT